MAALWSYSLKALMAPSPIGLGVITERETIGWCGIGTRACVAVERGIWSAQKQGGIVDVCRHVRSDREIGGRSTGHDESSRTQAASWETVRIGPTIIGAPHRGHYQHALDDEATSAADDEGCASSVRASASRTVRWALAR